MILFLLYNVIMCLCNRTSRSPRRSRSTIENPSYSPERPTSRSADRLNSGRPESCSHTGRNVQSPKRSISITGGPAKALSVSKRRPQSSDAGRSRSLPRAVPLSPVHSQDSSPEACGRPQKPLPGARSVADITQVNGDIDGSCDAERWEDLAASEPSLLDPHNTKSRKKHPNEVQCHQESPASNGVASAPSSGTLAHDTQRLQSWHDSSNEQPRETCLEDNLAKKKSIKSSLKNMFTFKKR